MITKTTTSSSNGYLHMHGVGRLVATLDNWIGIECVTKGCNHYYHIEGISAKNARELARQLVMASDEMDKMHKEKEARKK